MVLVEKKRNAPLRLCVDYRGLNDITEDTAQPMPVINEALKDLEDATIFTTLGLKSGYWQVSMEEREKKYTAFSTPDGETYQFRVMPYGLKGAPNTFQCLMSQEVLTGYLNEFCLVYLDDIIIY